ncbi:MAG: hypothetical protein M3396_08810 [Actinomycetota bacterium]|nr:hypothetical protein [Actinomycetota bacterium]MDQ3574713.1 hypothetical protein [Actinomycetota bacterium]
MLAVILVIVCLLFGVFAYFALYQMGLVPGPSSTETRSSSAPSLFGARTPLQDARRGDSQLSQGCLISVFVAAGLWFLLWGIVLIFALRFVFDPFG